MESFKVYPALSCSTSPDQFSESSSGKEPTKERSAMTITEQKIDKLIEVVDLTAALLKQVAYEQRRSAAFEALADRITQQATELRRL